MIPTVGRIVHYVSYGTPRGEYVSECRAAVVTRSDMDSGDVGLAVLSPSGIFFDWLVHYDETKRGGTWHWPERVETLSYE